MVIRVPEGPFREGLEDEFKEHGLVAIDFRETSPAKSEKEMYGIKKAGRMAAQVGGLAVGVPGELRGLELGQSRRRYSLPIEDLELNIQPIGYTVRYRGKRWSCPSRNWHEDGTLVDPLRAVLGCSGVYLFFAVSSRSQVRKQDGRAKEVIVNSCSTVQRGKKSMLLAVI